MCWHQVTWVGEGARLVAQLGGVIRWAVSVDINRAWKAEVAGWYYCTWWTVSLIGITCTVPGGLSFIRVTVPGGLCLR